MGITDQNYIRTQALKAMKAGGWKFPEDAVGNVTP
jgi:hypothetical protein